MIKIKTLIYFLSVFCGCLFIACNSKPDEAKITIYCTSDVHGSVFNYDLKTRKENRSSLANVSAYMKKARQEDSTGILLLDNGDFLQGQPSLYYSNFIDTRNISLVARVMNDLRYDAASVGNHDIEAGHPVYDKVVKEFQFPWLAANVIDTETRQPYFKPYTVLHRNGIKIAVLGMITPGVPKWLPKHLWEGLEFNDMIETAKIWIPKIQSEEQPDLIIGLFHSGYNYNYAGGNAATPGNENAGLLVAQQVDGFNIVLLGHDHQDKIEEITNNAGNKVLILNPKSHATYLGKITVDLKRNGKHYDKTYTPELIELAKIPQDSAYIQKFTPAFDTIQAYINTEIGEFTEPISSHDGIFSPSAFTDFIHNAQLSATGAEVSFSSVLQMNAQISKGIVSVRNMFNLYSFENGLYTMAFTGAEIDKYLEFACGLQYNTMRSATDHLLKFKTDSTGNLVKNKHGYYALANDFFNYSCAAGIKYIVDVSKEPGRRVEILSMSDGKPFYADSTYQVAINSYQGNGGGGHLTQGVGLSKEDIEKRILDIKAKDVRFYITEYIKAKKTVTPECRNDWKVVPENWFKAGKETDYKLLYK